MQVQWSTFFQTLAHAATGFIFLKYFLIRLQCPTFSNNEQMHLQFSELFCVSLLWEGTSKELAQIHRAICGIFPCAKITSQKQAASSAKKCSFPHKETDQLP